MALRVVPEGLAVVGPTVEALSLRLAAAHGGVGQLITAVISLAADPVASQGLVASSANGSRHAVGVAEGLGVGEAAADQVFRDVAASSYIFTGGWQ